MLGWASQLASDDSHIIPRFYIGSPDIYIWLIIQFSKDISPSRCGADRQEVPSLAYVGARSSLCPALDTSVENNWLFEKNNFVDLWKNMYFHILTTF
jgi:hypothetical protein